MKSYKLEVMRCSAHPDFWAVLLSDKDGGTRLTASKCCGRWDGVSRKSGRPTTRGPYVAFNMSAYMLREAAKALAAAADCLESDDAAQDTSEAERDARNTAS